MSLLGVDTVKSSLRFSRSSPPNWGASCSSSRLTARQMRRRPCSHRYRNDCHPHQSYFRHGVSYQKIFHQKLNEGLCTITIYNHFTGFPVHILCEGDGQDEPRQVHRRQKRQVTPKIHQGESDAQEKVGGYHAQYIWVDELSRQRISTVFRNFWY